MPYFGLWKYVRPSLEEGRWLWWYRLAQDVRFGLRMLRGNPGFGAVIILTLALGIEANTAVFSSIHAVLLRPLPFPDPDRLVFLSEASPEIPEMYFSMANLADVRTMNTVFSGIGATYAAGTYQYDNVFKLMQPNSSWSYTDL